MNKRLFDYASLLLAMAVGGSAAVAADPEVWYGVTHVGGTQYRYDYTVVNNAAVACGGLTAFFEDSGVYPLPDFQNIADVSSAAIKAKWNTTVGESTGPGPATAGFFDTGVTDTADAIAAGTGLDGFAASFDWNATGLPESQAFDVYDVNGNLLVTTFAISVLTMDTVTPAADALRMDVSWLWGGPAGLMTGFRVERSDGTDTGPWSVVGDVPDGNATTYSDTTVAAGGTYYYRVIAYNASFNSPPSNSISATTTSSPGGTITLVATPPIDAKVDLSWSGATGIVDGYRVERSATSNTGPFDTTFTLTGASTTTYSDTTVQRGTTYYYRVFAFSFAGDSAASNIEAVTVPLVDADQDGIPDASDNCPDTANANQADADADGAGDACDACANDPAKTIPGACGCGVADTDTDGDQTPDCLDGCPADSAKTSPGACGCGVAETDSDGDGVPNCQDSCPDDLSKTAPGACGCGVADTDADGDGTPDCTDSCPADPAKIVPGTCGCGTADVDTDQDGTPDCLDGCPADPDKTAPGDSGCGAAQQEPAVTAPVCGFGAAQAACVSMIGLCLLAGGRRRRDRTSGM